MARTTLRRLGVQLPPPRAFFTPTNDICAFMQVCRNVSGRGTAQMRNVSTVPCAKHQIARLVPTLPRLDDHVDRVEPIERDALQLAAERVLHDHAADSSADIASTKGS